MIQDYVRNLLPRRKAKAGLTLVGQERRWESVIAKRAGRSLRDDLVLAAELLETVIDEDRRRGRELFEERRRILEACR